VDRLVRWIKEAVAKHIFWSKPVSYSVSLWSSELTQLVRNAKRARRWYVRWPGAKALRVYLAALNTQGETIRKAKAVHLKHAVAEAARRRRGIWQLVKWAKTRTPTLPPPFPIMKHHLELPRP
jgi:hypothetical protein